MRLPDSRAHRLVEHSLHAIAALALICAAWLCWRLLDERESAYAAADKVQEALARWSTAESPGRAHVLFDALPAPQVRDWVAALRGAGTVTTWQGHSLPASGLTMEPIVDPKHPVRIWVAAAPGSKVSLYDELGAMANLETGREGGTVITAPRAQGVIRAQVAGAEASAVMKDELKIQPLLLLATAGWEGKFAMAALEEHGWKVDARFTISSKQTVMQGESRPQIDTEHYAAVIALDGAAARYAGAIERFVRAGGGLIAAGEAAQSPMFASLLGAKAGAPSPEEAFSDDPAIRKAPRSVLALAPLNQLKGDAVALERGPNDEIAAAARRVGEGRVLQVGYNDTWRWRTAGTDDEPVAAHRRWWSGMVSSVAYAPRTPFAATQVVEPTPLATLVSTLGPQSAPSSGAILSRWLDPRFLKWLFAIALGALFLEWTSRRLRGAP